MPDGTIAAGWTTRVAFLNADGTTRTTLDLPIANVADLDATADGDLVIGDGGARALVIIDDAGQLLGRIEGSFSSLAGIDVENGTAYVASPSGGLLYAVPLDGAELTVLPLSGQAVRQPSDILLAPDGRYYIADFELRRIVVSPDGSQTENFSGAAGTGEQVPKLAFYGGLVLVTDPLNARVLAYDRAGKQRGVYVFPNAPKSVRGVGIAVSPDGLVYVADVENGTVHRLRIDIPPDTAAELQSIEQ
jgi:sugar lactone lactonase YvrE